MFSKSTHVGLFGCLLLVVIACGLPGAFAGGASGCYAGPFFFGPTCDSDTSIIGSHGLTITYSISVVGNTQLCCNGYFCSGSSCSLRNVGCGYNSWSTSSLNWGNNLATPKMECKGNPFGSTYSFSH